MNLVVLIASVSIILSLFALNDDPVSVSSTIASTRFGHLTSVAPHENSTFTFMPLLSKIQEAPLK